MAQATPALKAVGEENWRGIRLTNAYRVLLAFALVVAAVSGRGPQVLGQEDSYLFAFAAWGYLLLVIGFELLLELRVIGFRPQVHLHALGDLLILTLIMHSAGGPGGGIALLLIISVALSTVLLGGRAGLSYAALAAIAVLGEAVWGSVIDQSQRHFAAAGLLGVALFVVSGLVVSVEGRAHRYQRLTVRREQEVSHLSALAVQIIEQFEDGVVIADSNGRIEYINSAARQLLGVDEGTPAPESIGRLSLSLLAALDDWCHDEGPDEVDLDEAAARFRVSFNRLDSVLGQRALLVLIDLRAEDARLQQRKLAALGRLTASIAHEVRNPLSSIRHGAELLAGAADDEERQQLVSIIVKQSERINDLVQSVLDAARRPQINAADLPIAAWLDEYVRTQQATLAAERRAGSDEAEIEWQLVPSTEPLTIRFDPAHLWQILDNLVTNARRHGRSTDGILRLRFAWQAIDNDRIQLRICDEGAGMDAETRAHLFEPFFTTHAEGVGLGLFISRELAEANQARLNVDSTDGGCCFVLEAERGETGLPVTTRESNR